MAKKYHGLNGDLDFIFNQNKHIWKKLKNKNLFLTGCTGPFGFWLIKSLLYADEKISLNCKIFVLTRNKNSDFFKYFASKSIKIVYGDVRKFKFFKKRIDLIIHGATTTAKETFNNQDPIEKFSVLFDGTNRVLEFAKKSKAKKFLFLSSGAVYGNRDKKIKFTESSRLAPNTNDLNFDVSVLGEAKRAAELSSIIFSNKNFCKVNIARCFSFIGPYMPLGVHYAVGNFFWNSINKNKILINGNPKTSRSYLHFVDLTIILWRILLSNKNREIFNIGSDKSVSMITLSKKIKKIIPNVKIKIIKNSNQKAISHYIPSIQKIKKHFNFKINYSLDQSLKKMYQNILQNKKFYNIK